MNILLSCGKQCKSWHAAGKMLVTHHANTLQISHSPGSLGVTLIWDLMSIDFALDALLEQSNVQGIFLNVQFIHPIPTALSLVQLFGARCSMRS
jgi:hypothetical protein